MTLRLRPVARFLAVAAVLLYASSLAVAGPGPGDMAAVDEPSMAVALTLPDGVDRDAVLTRLHTEADALARDLSRSGPADPAEVHAFLARQVAARLDARDKAGLVTTSEQVERDVIAFEAFRARAFVSSGVFPKRYHGYVDAQGDTAALELRFVRAVQASARVANAWLEEQGIAWRVTEQEVAVTWIAEGGAWLLGRDKDQADRVHPILGIGLDDIAHGFKELPGLVGRMDAAAGTHVEDIPAWQDGQWRLTRYMTLEESVVGTAIMWVWEKRIADRKLAETGRPPMQDHDARDQFILGSLVYNSGLLHNGSRPAQVRRFALADHLAGIAREHPRRYLPVAPPAASLAALLVDEAYPEQWTGWIALYHILQRYGGYIGLEEYSETFDAEGRFLPARWDALEARLAEEAAKRAEAEAEAAEAEGIEAEAREMSLEPRSSGSWGCGCATADPSLPGWLGGLALLGLGALRRRQSGREARPTQAQVERVRSDAGPV